MLQHKILKEILKSYIYFTSFILKSYISFNHRSYKIENKNQRNDIVLLLMIQAEFISFVIARANQKISKNSQIFLFRSCFLCYSEISEPNYLF